MFRLLPLVVVTALAVTTAPAVAAQTDPAQAPRVSQQTVTQHKAVFDMTSDRPGVWDATLRNLENLTVHYGAGNTQFEVVAHGTGIGLVLKTNTGLAARMEALAKQGVVFAACHNTMKRKHISKDALLPFVVVVPAGVAELIDKQAAGWAYIKAGH